MRFKNSLHWVSFGCCSFGPVHLRIDYPRQVLGFRPFKVIGRAKFHGFEVAADVQDSGQNQDRNLGTKAKGPLKQLSAFKCRCALADDHQ